MREVKLDSHLYNLLGRVCGNGRKPKESLFHFTFDQSHCELQRNIVESSYVMSLSMRQEKEQTPILNLHLKKKVENRQNKNMRARTSSLESTICNRERRAALTLFGIP
jgi:hypothetical protein